MPKRVDGLSAILTMLKLNHDGSQRIMRETKVTEGCLGDVAHDQKLMVGNVRKIVFGKNDLPPVADQTCPKYDTPLGIFDEKNMTVAELQTTLERNSLNSDSDKPKLIERCNAAGISTIKRF